jgi:hypothetical protein
MTAATLPDVQGIRTLNARVKTQYQEANTKVASAYKTGSPAIIEKYFSVRPETLRHHLSMVLPFSVKLPLIRGRISLLNADNINFKNN